MISDYPRKFDLISFDLFDTLVFLQPTDYDPWLKLDEALLKSFNFKKKILPRVSVSTICQNYFKYIKKQMSSDIKGKEFKNDQVLLDIWRTNGIQISSEIEEIAVQIVNYYFEIITPLIQVFPRVHDVLEHLKKEGYSLILTSNFSYPPAGYDILEKHNLIKYFNRIIFSGDVGWKKPSLKFFTKALNKNNLIKDRILHIGDDFVADIKGSLEYGIKALWINRSDQEIDESLVTERFLGKISKIDDIIEIL